MKKPRFLLLWILWSPFALGLGLVGHTLFKQAVDTPSATTTAYAHKMTRTIEVAKHPDANLCVMHYPKFGSFHIAYIGQVDCQAVPHQLALTNHRLIREDLSRMAFVRDRSTPSICYGVRSHETPILVDCQTVAHLIRGEEYCPQTKTPHQ